MRRNQINLPLLKDTVEILGLALATHNHQWTITERRLWERAWQEIRRHQGDPADPPITTLQTPHKGHVRRPGHGRPTRDSRAAL